jgi:DNA polymerase-3 subunit epsilon
LGFDLETTGVDTDTDVPVSYSFVSYDHGVCTGVKGGLINPERAIPDEAIAVHGITNERARTEGADLESTVVEIADRLVVASRAGIPVVGMNVSFDLKMIDACSRRLTGVSLQDAGWIGPVLDVLVIDRAYDRYRKGSRKLIDLCAHYGVGEGANLHEAQADVQASIAVLLKQAEIYPGLESMGLDELHVAQQKWHRDWAEHFSSYLVSKGKDPLAEAGLAWPLTASEIRKQQMRI